MLLFVENDNVRNIQFWSKKVVRIFNHKNEY